MNDHGSVDFNETPFIVIWEVTQACALACRHCRAEAIDVRDPAELTLREGKALIDQIAAMGTRVFVLTGGDPLQREDLESLIAHAKERGLRVGAIPAATNRLTKQRVLRLKSAGLDQMALSLDAASAASHDAFRGVDGAFERTMKGAQFAREAGLHLQVNTSFAAWNVDEFDALSELVERLGIAFWEVFFVIPTGRGAEMETLTAEHYETIFAKLYALQARVSFIVKITEAPYYRVFVVNEERRRNETAAGSIDARLRKLLAREIGPRGSMGQATRGVNAGKGFMFISHTGEVYPSGFLPVTAGNIRQVSLDHLYRSSTVFKELRNNSLLKGRCGQCFHKDLCGGSRSRAFALTGDYLAADASCHFA